MTENVSAEEFEDLVRRISITKEIRYSASLRLRRELKTDQLVINFVNFVGIVFSLISLVFANEFTPKQISIVGVALLVLSIYSIIISYEFNIVDYSKTIAVLENSADDMREIYVGVRNKKELSRIEYTDVFDKYNVLLKRFPYTHLETDFSYIVVKNPHLKGKVRQEISDSEFWIKLRHEWSHVFNAFKGIVVPFITLAVGAYLIYYFRS